MAQDAVINGTTYPAVEAVALTDGNGNVTQYYPDAVRYVAQTLTEAQKAQVRENIGAISEVDVPVKGKDYWTEADQESIVQQVIAALGTPVFGTVGENSNIILTGDLGNGNHSFYYEDADGNRTAIGNIEIGAVNYTNQIPIATDDAGDVYNGKGYKENTRVTGGNDVEYPGVTTTGYIPVNEGDIIYLKNVHMLQADSTDYKCRATIFNAKTGVNGSTFSNLNRDTEKANWVWDENGNAVQFSIPSYYFDQCTPSKAAFVRIGAAYIGPDSIITVNEPIE